MSKKLLSVGVVLALIAAVLVSVPTAGAQTSTCAAVDALVAAGVIAPDKVAAAKAAAGCSASASVSFTRELTVGSTGADVTALQVKLGVTPATGYFGAITKAAVMAYQAANGLPATGYVGPMTLAKLNASVVVVPTPSTPSTPSSSLNGGEASLEAFDLSSGDDDEVMEGSSAEVAEIEFDVEDGDVEVNRVDLALVGSGEETDPWDAFDSLTLLVDGKKIGEVDLSDEDNYLDEDDGTIRVSDLDLVVKQGDSVKIVVEVTAQNSVDGADADDAAWTINVLADGIRTTDGEGITQYIGSASESVSFDIVVEGEGEELNVSTSSEDPEADTFKVEDDAKSEWFTIFAFDLESEESDIELDSVQIALSLSATSSDMVDDLILEIDGDEFDDWSYVSGSTTTSSVVEFDIDGDFTVDADSEVTAVLKAKFKAANGVGYSSSTTNTIEASVADEGIEGEGADDVVSDGTATGEEHNLAMEGVVVTLVSKDDDTTGTDDTLGSFEFVVDVKAFEEDAFIELAATRGTTTANTGFNVVITDGTNTTVLTGTTTFAISADEDETSNNRVEVSEGDTVRFTVLVTFDAATTGTYKAVLHSVNFNDTDADEDTQYDLVPVSTYRTTGTSVEAGS